MLRVRYSQLTLDREAHLRFEGELFSGLAYVVAPDDLVLQVEQVDGGQAGAQSTDWLPLPPNGMRVDMDSLEIEGDYGPYLRHDVPFTGIAYLFEPTGHCVAELAFLDGKKDVASGRGWYRSGQPEYLVEGQHGTTWFEDGSLKATGIGSATLLNVIVRDGALDGILLAERSLLDIDAIAKYPMAARLMLTGVGIDAPLLALLGERAGLGGVQRLTLVATGAGDDAVETIAGFDGLQVLTLRNNPGFGHAAAARLRALRPDVKVDEMEHQ